MKEAIHTFLPFNRVAIRDEFWSLRQSATLGGSLPAIYDYFKKTGRFAAFRLDWKPGMEPVPHIFWDSDVAKWVEAASYALLHQPDALLRERLDEVVDLIVSAQQPDGYMGVYFTVVKPEARWSNLLDLHELYTAGHLMEAGIAHFQATGGRTLLDAVCRFADLIDTVFGTDFGKKRGYCGHEEIELALVRLYRVTGQARYLVLAQYFVDERGRQPSFFDLEEPGRTIKPRGGGAVYDYVQAHKPLREQTRVVGHAVRAMYIYSAMADLAAETGDETLVAACRNLWADLTLRNIYITGGVGTTRANEGFTTAYDLPNLTAYAETCAAIGLVFWAQRMLRVSVDRTYSDILEKALFNGVLSGASLDGRKFFYENPLASLGLHHRQEGFGCSCCPPNLARLVMSVGGYAYSVGEREVAVHFYLGGTVEASMPGGPTVRVTVETRYPWDGAVRIRLGIAQPATFGLRLRIPGWCPEYGVRVNGEPADPAMERGYVVLHRQWSGGDGVELTLQMPVVRMEAHPDLLEDRGRVALQRGPLVYCLEDGDHAGSVHHLRLPRESDLVARWDAGLLGGMTVIEGPAVACDPADWAGRLYQPAGTPLRPAALRAIPYFAWENRRAGGMTVWIPEHRIGEQP